MNIISDAAHDRVQHPTGDTHAVQVAYEAVCCFGDNLTREQAEGLLELWKWEPGLSRRERAALLDRFPQGGIRVCGDAR